MEERGRDGREEDRLVSYTWSVNMAYYAGTIQQQSQEQSME